MNESVCKKSHCCTSLLLILLIVLLTVPASGFAKPDMGLTLTSEYVFQGISQTDDSPVIQAGISQDFTDNLYASLWVSEIDYVSIYPSWDDNSIEADYSLSYRHNPGADLSSSITFTHYNYEADSVPYDYDYNELSLALEYQQRFLAAINYSKGLFASDTGTFSYQATWQQILPSELLLAAGAGYNDISKIAGSGYAYWNLTVSSKINDFVVDIGYYQADRDAESIYGENRAGARFTLSVSYGF
jgi:uncharacterized protein (TIGR02001 family)